MDTAQNSQDSYNDRRLSLLEQEINAILSAAGITANDKVCNQVLTSLNDLYGPQGLTGQFVNQQITQAAGASLVGAEIALYAGSPTPPGLISLGNATRGEFRTRDYFADSPLGPNTPTYGYLKTGSTFKDTPEGMSSNTWFFQEWINFAGGSNNRPMRYLRSNVNNGGWSAWAAQEAIDTTNMFNYTGPDLPLAVGQSFSYDTGNTAVSVVPLSIAVGPGQFYEINLVQRFPGDSKTSWPYSQINLDMYLLPNNNAYLGAFSCSSIASFSTYVEVGNLNPNYANWTGITDNATYTAPPVIAGQNTGGGITPPPYANKLQVYTQSASGFPGVPTNSSLLAGFWFDDIAGYTNPPYIRKILVYTGDSYTVPMAFHVGGGGSYAYNSGVNTVAAVWQNYFQVGYYNSLGTIMNTYIPPLGNYQGNQNVSSVVTCSFLANVKRLA